ncbi:MAG: NAD(P)(+) transhydrogenase (Re/Si-specific) subunit beta [Streptosporangiaceae bacterium]
MAGEQHTSRRISAEDAATQLAYASKVIIVPGTGMFFSDAKADLAEIIASVKALVASRGRAFSLVGVQTNADYTSDYDGARIHPRPDIRGQDAPI